VVCFGRVNGRRVGASCVRPGSVPSAKWTRRRGGATISWPSWAAVWLGAVVVLVVVSAAWVPVPVRSCGVSYAEAVSSELVTTEVASREAVSSSRCS
jgi:hypothetical protein